MIIMIYAVAWYDVVNYIMLLRLFTIVLNIEIDTLIISIDMFRIIM